MRLGWKAQTFYWPVYEKRKIQALTAQASLPASPPGKWRELKSCLSRVSSSTHRWWHWETCTEHVGRDWRTDGAHGSRANWVRYNPNLTNAAISKTICPEKIRSPLVQEAYQKGVAHFLLYSPSLGRKNSVVGSSAISSIILTIHPTILSCEICPLHNWNQHCWIFCSKITKLRSSLQDLLIFKY